SVMEVPRLEKIVINSGLGDATSDSKIIEIGLKELHLITGQKPVATKSKKSIATFKLREGQAIGAKVTLRKENMWNFLTKLISIAIPRIRDFRGLSVKSFDGKGNYTFGIKEQIIFPEIVYDDVKKIRGFDITIVTSAKTDKEALFLLKELGMPFVKTKETK
ncbi:MAG: 50S ribosomal protein L5, partial [Malacoplasma sp.]|nr:50S ribosomal protein L5 [Malacoplasma sp.]